MPRRYNDVETKLVTDLQPGDEMVIRKAVKSLTRVWTESSHHIDVEWSDGSVTSYDLTGDPAVDVVMKQVR